MIKVSRRQFVKTTALAASVSVGSRFTRADDPEDVLDFTNPLDGWETISGKWTVQDVPGASRNGRALVQCVTASASGRTSHSHPGRGRTTAGHTMVSVFMPSISSP
jgi:hypothetical protein